MDVRICIVLKYMFDVGYTVGYGNFRAQKKGLTIECKSLFLLMAGATRLELATSGVTEYQSQIFKPHDYS